MTTPTWLYLALYPTCLATRFCFLAQRVFSIHPVTPFLVAAPILDVLTFELARFVLVLQAIGLGLLTKVLLVILLGIVLLNIYAQIYVMWIFLSRFIERVLGRAKHDEGNFEERLRWFLGTKA